MIPTMTPELHGGLNAEAASEAWTIEPADGLSGEETVDKRLRCPLIVVCIDDNGSTMLLRVSR